MKIAHLISSQGLFGAENVVLNLCRNSLSGKQAVWVGTLNDERCPHLEIIDKAKSLGMQTFTVDCMGRFDLRAVFTLKRFIQENKIDLLHTHNYKSDCIGLLASRLSGIPVVATAHGFTDMTHAVSFYEKLDRWVLKNFFNRVVVVSEKVLPHCPQHKKRVIRNGLDLKQFSADRGRAMEFRRKFQIAENDFVIGTVGRLSREKNQHLLIEAFAKFAEHKRDSRLVIVGEGPEEESLKAKVENLKLGNRVIFTGLIKDVAPVYPAMDVFVLSSLTEGVPLTILEAMASRVPVVATKVGGIPEIITDGTNGLLVESKDADALADRLENLFRDKLLRQKITEDAFDLVRAGYSLETMLSEYQKVYEEVLTVSLRKMK